MRQIKRETHLKLQWNGGERKESAFIFTLLRNKWVMTAELLLELELQMANCKCVTHTKCLVDFFPIFSALQMIGNWNQLFHVCFCEMNTKKKCIEVTGIVISCFLLIILRTKNHFTFITSNNTVHFQVANQKNLRKLKYNWTLFMFDICFQLKCKRSRFYFI